MVGSSGSIRRLFSRETSQESYSQILLTVYALGSDSPLSGKQERKFIILDAKAMPCKMHSTTLASERLEQTKMQANEREARDAER